MKCVSYSLFGDPNSFEFPFYLRGVYFNARMNRLIYPGWNTFIYVSDVVFNEHQDLLIEIGQIFCVNILEVEESSRCESMLWRICPVYDPSNISHILCRDADAITTYREAQAVQEWVDSGLGFHGITDDPAHTIPIMGGMCGFRTDIFKATFPEYDTFDKLISGANLKDHGSDQNLLMKKIWPKAKSNMMLHAFQGCKEKVTINKYSVNNQIPGVNPKLWESNLTCRMIGSPGVVDFELLRFFKRFDNNPKYDEFESRYPETFYWRNA